MGAVPAELPVITPVVSPTVAVELLLLLQVAPAVVVDKVVVAPIHTEAVPVMAPGSGLTVTVTAALQPLGDTR